MTVRTTRETITFLRPFSLTAVDETICAGTYVVEMLEETIEGLSFVGYRRVSTSITIASNTYGPAVRQVIEVDPMELEHALKRDMECETATEPPPVGPSVSWPQR